MLFPRMLGLVWRRPAVVCMSLGLTGAFGMADRLVFAVGGLMGGGLLKRAMADWLVLVDWCGRRGALAA
ncbi:hypothetical protein BI344_10340 [Chromobacterium sphagni]|uniref:Uncharacterized protein n=1 Tax=Chromobacterium sphagni TaxID=1903179 RepID=A0ABX3C9S2_9NEIS|nr:hypothetical protein BI344_10340 [Chromobacterium sphagni]